MSYLIAHKVSGEPAFDIAARIDCPLCADPDTREFGPTDCAECGGTGYWWIIPTSGHRAYPWFFVKMTELEGNLGTGYLQDQLDIMPDPWPDHYSVNDRPAQAGFGDLSSLLNLPKPTPITRRL